MDSSQQVCFLAAQYDAEVDRALQDHSWETQERKAARLIYQAVDRGALALREDLKALPCSTTADLENLEPMFQKTGFQTLLAEFTTSSIRLEDAEGEERVRRRDIFHRSRPRMCCVAYHRN